MLNRASGVSYLVKIESMSSSAACNEGAVPLTTPAGATGDAPFVTAASVSVRFRFAGEGDAGADGGAGGVKAPLTAVDMVMGTPFRDTARRESVQDAEDQRCGWRAARRKPQHNAAVYQARQVHSGWAS